MLEVQFDSCGCTRNEYTFRIKDVQRGQVLFQTMWHNVPSPTVQAGIRQDIQQALAQYALTVPPQWAAEWWAQ